MKAAVRPYRAEDLRQVLRLLEAGDDPWPGVDAATRLLRDAGAAGVVAEADGSIVGCAFGSIAEDVGWIYRAGALNGEIETQLLDALESALIAELDAPAALTELGGRMIPPGLWDELRGMDEAKEIIERRVILPLAEPELAARHAVAPPKAIVLFGPPGTGKTTFAKGIASRLGWPFVEIEPAELGAEGAERQAKLLAETFDRLLELPAAVVFVDEVEDIASIRQEERRVSPSITNEFLKQIPRMREAPHHLLACATNSVGLLDPAFLRPGRFDYVLPVRPPNDEARAAIWGR